MIPIAWVTGIIGNTIGLIVFFRKAMHKVGPVLAYKMLFVSDLFFMPFMIDSFMLQVFGRGINIGGNLNCKIYYFFSYLMVNWSPMCMVYISLEKLIAIKYPAKRFIMRKQKTQLIYFMVLLVYYALSSIPPLFYYEIKYYYLPNNQTKLLKACTYTDLFGRQFLSILYLINKTVIPFTLMITCSVLLAILVFKLRQRIIQNFLSKTNKNNNEGKRYKDDIRFAFTSILLNIIYLVLNAPIAIILNLPINTRSNFIMWITLNISFYSFVINFYMILLSNNLTRKEFLNLIKEIIRVKNF